MSDQFPRMIYQVGDQEEMHGGRFNYEIVYDQDALDRMLGDGWYMTTSEAKEAADPKPAEADETPLSRDEIEAKASALGIQFDGRTSDAKLLAKIDVALTKETP